MSIASTASSVARRRLMSGVAVAALCAGVLIAYHRLQARIGPVELPALSAAATLSSLTTRSTAATSTAATLAPDRTPAPRAPSAQRVALSATTPRADSEPVRLVSAATEAGWERVMIAPERRVERMLAPVTALIDETVLLEPERVVERASGETVTTPARYGVRARRVEVQPARTVIETVPAVWEWRRRATQ
jgi:hypothetical protein